MTRRARDLLAAARAAAPGLSVAVGQTGGDHIRITLAAPDGRTRFVIAPNSPSDRRSIANFRADVRREARLLETTP